MPLPQVPQSQLDLRGMDLAGLPPRFMNTGEREVIIALMKGVKARRVLEIGCHTGGTALGILRNVRTIDTYVGIDVPSGYVTEKSVQRGEIPVQAGQHVLGDERFHLMVRPRGSFEIGAVELMHAGFHAVDVTQHGDTSVKWAMSGSEKFDAVFIDGDHGRAGVENDTRLAREILRPGGVIIWHDYHNLGTVDVREVLDEMHASGAPITHVAGTWVAYEYV